ncbi:MAG: hypothetical protein ACRD3T_21775 [Terriglobia bacterium]
MSTNLTKETPPSETLEWLVSEAVESSEPLEKLRRKSLGLKRGSEAYSDTLAEIAVAVEVRPQSRTHRRLAVGDSPLGGSSGPAKPASG